MTTLLLPRTQSALRPSHDDAARGMPGNLPYDRGLVPGLRESERAIVRLFGSQAIAELRDMGMRCVGDAAFAAQVNRIGPPESDPESWAKLASVMPDYLIASYTLRTFLCGAVTPEFLRGIPQNGKSLIGLALGLQRFSNQAELQLAIRAERELSLVPHSEPIWSRFAPSFFDSYRSQQRTAYEKRLAIQPGGREALEALRAESVFSKNLTRVITGTLVQATMGLEAHDAEHIRALGREFHSKHWKPISPEALSSGRLRRLIASDGSVFEPPPELLQKVRILHHEAWGEARTLVAGTLDAPRSAANVARLLTNYVPPELLQYNLDTIAALTWIVEIGILEDKLHEAASGSKPATLIIKSDRNATLSEALPDSCETTDQQEDTVQAKNAGVLIGREIEHPENIRLVQQVKQTITQGLLKKDLNDLRPVLISIDHLPGDIREPKFLELIQELRDVHGHRRALVESITTGLLSSRSNEISLLVPEAVSTDLYDSVKLLDTIPHPQRVDVRDRMLRLHETKERVVAGLGSEVERLQAFTELLDPAHVEAELSAIKTLMEPHIVEHYGTKRYQDFGGIFGSSPYLDTLQTHCAQGGSILVRRKISDGSKQLDGIFIYGLPGSYPQQISELLTTIAPHKDLSFAVLFMTAPDRAAGTYMSLLRGMAARLVLQGARYSLGTVGEENLKHHNLLVSLDHVPLPAASLTLKERKARFIPMLWELP